MKKIGLALVLMALFTFLICENNRNFIFDVGFGLGPMVHRIGGWEISDKEMYETQLDYSGRAAVDFGLRMGYRNWDAPVYFTGEVGYFYRQLSADGNEMRFYQRYFAPGILVSTGGGLEFGGSIGLSNGEFRRDITFDGNYSNRRTAEYLSTGSGFEINAFSLYLAVDLSAGKSHGFVAGIRYFNAINDFLERDNWGWGAGVPLTTSYVGLVLRYRMRY